MEALAEGLFLLAGFALALRPTFIWAWGFGGAFSIRRVTSSSKLSFLFVMATKTQILAINLYADLMKEVKLRIAAIDHCTMNKSGLNPSFVKEFAHLQIRMICELVAIGCLVAHGDITDLKTKNIGKQWSAEKIMNALEELHAHFFPRAGTSSSMTMRP